MWGRSKKQALAFVKDRIANKVQGWKHAHLFQAGTEILIKSVLCAIPSYPMSIFLFTDGVCNDLDAEFANFWWGSTDGNRKIHWMSWSKLVLAKSKGGLGFRSLKEFNLSLLDKMCWRILQHPEALWVQVLKELYFPNSDFLSAKKGARASWAWSSILEGRKCIEEFARWQVLNGESIRTLEDRWIPGIPSGKLHASQLAASEFEPYQRVADLINWDVPCWDLFPIVEHLSVMEQYAIMPIPLSMEWENDKLVIFGEF